MPEQDPIWSSHPSVSRALSQETQPSPRVQAAALKPSGRRKPIGCMCSPARAVIVLMCVSLSVVLASIGPGVLALRDRWLGRNLQETVSTIGRWRR
jgi:hypothetical protein